MSIWQVSTKKEHGAEMELREFPTRWRAILWAARKLRSNQIAVIVRIDE